MPAGGSSAARRSEYPARRGLKLESTWKSPFPYADQFEAKNGWEDDDDIPCSTPAARCLARIPCRRVRCCQRRRAARLTAGAPGHPPGRESRHPAHQIVRRRRRGGRRLGPCCGIRIRRTNPVHLNSALSSGYVPTLLIAACISWNTSFSTGREKSTPLISAPNVGCNSVTMILLKAGG